MTVRELITRLLDHPMDGEVAVCDRTSWDAADRIMNDPETDPQVVLALGVAKIGGYQHRRTNDLVDVRRILDGDFQTLLVVTGMAGESQR